MALRQAQVPGGAYANETRVRQSQGPGFQYYNDSTAPTTPGFASYSSYATASAATNHTIDKPPGTVSGDLLIACMQYQNNGFITASPPAGWTGLGSETTNSSGHYVWWKLAGGAEPSTYTFTISSSNPATITIARYTGTDQTTPINASAHQLVATTTTVAAPTITPTTNGCLLVQISSLWNGTTQPTFTPPNSYFEESDSGITFVGGIEFSDLLQPTAAATGTISSTSTGPNGDAAGWNIAIAPSAGGGGSVALTGSAATFSAGTITPATDVATTGVSATGQTGTLSGGQTISGSAATFSAGTLTPALAVPLTGQHADFATGTISAGNDVNVALTGSSATFSAGTLVPALAVTLTGSASTTQAGTAVPSNSVAITNVVITGQAGTMAPTLSVAVTGASGTAQAGTETPAIDVPLGGSQAVWGTGTITVPGIVTLTGAQANFFQGTIIPTGGTFKYVQGLIYNASPGVIRPHRAFEGLSFPDNSQS